MKIKCFIFRHDWEYDKDVKKSPYRIRRCKRCNKVERSQYDMMYGTTTWVS